MTCTALCKPGEGGAWNEPAAPPRWLTCTSSSIWLTTTHANIQYCCKTSGHYGERSTGLTLHSTDADNQGSEVSMKLFLLSSSEPPPTLSPYHALLPHSLFAELARLANLEAEARLSLIFRQVSKFEETQTDVRAQEKHMSSREVKGVRRQEVWERPQHELCFFCSTELLDPLKSCNTTWTPKHLWVYFISLLGDSARSLR